MGLFRKSNEKCNVKCDVKCDVKFKEKKCKKSCLKKPPVCNDACYSACSKSPRSKSPCDPNPCCGKPVCICKGGTACACCKPGCSPRMPCMACIKNGVKVQVKQKKCQNLCEPFCQSPKKLICCKSQCEIVKEECEEVNETVCCVPKKPKCKPDECKPEVCCPPVKTVGSDCKVTCVKKSSSCGSFKPCPCPTCKVSCLSDKSCNKKCDDGKSCDTSCRPKNGCKTTKKQECPSPCMSSSCPKPYSYFENYCNEKVDEACPVYEQGDFMSCFPVQEANCCGPQKMSTIPSTCLPSVGSFVVPHISKPCALPCPCGSRTCSNSGLVFQQAIQSSFAAKRYP